MRLAIDMMRILYIVNLYQPISRQQLSELFVSETRTEKILNIAIRLLQSDNYLSSTEPFYCRPRGLAALQSVKLYKARDTGRLLHLKSLAKSDTVATDERSG